VNSQCDHTSPRHLVDKFDDDGQAEQYWMCCDCGEIVGKYIKADTRGCTFDKDNHVWRKENGETVSEYTEGQVMPNATGSPGTPTHMTTPPRGGERT